MIKRIEWRGARWARRRTTVADGGAPVLTRERARELEQPTFLRRGLTIEGLSGWPARGARSSSARD